MAGGAEGDTLGGDGGVWVEGVVGGDEAGDVDQVFWQGRLAGLVWCLDCGAGAHAMICLVVWVCALHGSLYGMRVAGGNGVGIRDDTEVAAKDACVLGAVSLKREYSQLFVLFLEYRSAGSRTTPATCIAEFWIVEGWNGPWCASFA
jgi:hypothetical protein